MACFLVPAGAGVVTTLLRRRLPAASHPERLSALLLGGSAMLAVEHVSHGEVVPWPPFLTAMRSPAETAQMLREMFTVGGTMTAVLILVWLLMLALEQKLQLQPQGRRRCG
ncbi:MAG: hypothetical protein ABIK38_04940 [candidate division WOR-3 bacterium]